MVACCIFPSIMATAAPGAALRIETSELDAYQQQLLAKNYANARPGIETMPWGSRDMTIHDPFGNRLVFTESEPA